MEGKVQIWKAVSIDLNAENVAIDDNLQIDRFVLDSKSGNQQGGTGKVFDWSLIPENIKVKSLLAGGINPENIEQALQQGCLGVDLNSGVEGSKGVKDFTTLTACFEKIKKVENKAPRLGLYCILLIHFLPNHKPTLIWILHINI